MSQKIYSFKNQSIITIWGHTTWWDSNLIEKKHLQNSGMQIWIPDTSIKKKIQQSSMPIPTLHNKIVISADFLAKIKIRLHYFFPIFGRKFSSQNQPKWKSGYGEQSLFSEFLNWCVKKWTSLCYVICLQKGRFDDFSPRGYLSGFYWPWNILSGIQICIPLFWGIFLQLGSGIIKQCSVDLYWWRPNFHSFYFVRKLIFWLL